MYKIVIVGRQNVGKSTLFNRLIEEKKSIVSVEPGTTRDRIYGTCSWQGKSFILVDIGGIRKIIKGEIEKEIQKQITIALEEANLILFLLDDKEGITKEDREIAKELKKLKKPILLVLNKIDSPKERKKINEKNFLKLGLGKPFLVSAANGSGTGDLLDEIVKYRDRDIWQSTKEKGIKVAIIGKTNVGKSTLVNSILGQERVIVTPLPQTTRQPIDTYLECKGKPMILIDTAGIRRRAKIKKEVERIGIEKSLKMIERADIVLLMLDILEKVSHLERTLAKIIKREKKSVILVVNKFDLAKVKMEKYLEYFQGEFSSLWWAPIIFISAKEKINLEKLLDLIFEIEEKKKEIFEPEKLNRILKNLIKEYNFSQRFWPKAKLEQKKNEIPIFILSLPKLTRKEIPPRQAQINLLEKNIREEFNLWGVPINLKIEKL